MLALSTLIALHVLSFPGGGPMRARAADRSHSTMPLIAASWESI
jgi:hypothetical protein